MEKMFQTTNQDIHGAVGLMASWNIYNNLYQDISSIKKKWIVPSIDEKVQSRRWNVLVQKPRERSPTFSPFCIHKTTESPSRKNYHLVMTNIAMENPHF